MNSGDEEMSNNEIDPEIVDAFKQTLLYMKHGQLGDGSRSTHSSHRVRIQRIQGFGRGFIPSGASRDLLPTERPDSELNRLKDSVLELSLSQNRHVENFNIRLARKEQEIDELKIENAKLQEKVASLEEHTERCDKENSDLKKQLQLLQVEVSKLQDYNTLYQGDITAMVEERRQRAFKD